MLREKGVVAVCALIGLLFVVYAGAKAFPYLKGPDVKISFPKEGGHIGSATFLLSGKAIRTKELYLSGKSVRIDTEGNFSEMFVSYAPYTILTVEAVDMHGKREFQTLTVSP